MLLDDAVDWAVDLGARVLHIGGGRGGHDDSLLWFKSGFSQRLHQFHTGRWILDPSRYEALRVARVTLASDPHLIDQSYFPEYRAPVLGLNSAPHDLAVRHEKFGRQPKVLGDMVVLPQRCRPSRSAR